MAVKEAAAEVRRRKVPAVVVDAEDGPTRLGLAAELAEAMGARNLTRRPSSTPPQCATSPHPTEVAAGAPRPRAAEPGQQRQGSRAD